MAPSRLPEASTRLPEASNAPSGENRSASTGAVWPARVMIFFLLTISHTMTVWSRLPLARVFPSGENAAAYMMSVCPLRTPDW